MAQVTIDQAMQVAVQHHRAGKLAEAEGIYRDVLAQQPNHPDALNLLGVIARQTGQLDTSIELIRLAIAANPRNPDYHNNLGNALRDKGLLDESIAALRQALNLNPNLAEVHNNLGNVLGDKGVLDEAVICYREAIRLKPDFARAHNHLSHALLQKGEFDQGWREHEWRWRCEDFPSPQRNFTQPYWDGSTLEGRTILFHAEQGFGDAIQFARYVPMVASRGGKVVLECKPELFELFQTLPGAPEVVRSGESLPQFDLHCPLLSLPLIFGTTLKSIPATVPYLTPNITRRKYWADKLGPAQGHFRVGLVWSGNPAFKLDRWRSISLMQLVPLLGLETITFYSLQKGPAAEEISHLPPGMTIINLGPDLRDFNDTAAIISLLDLVISTDTSVPHLAGALATPVWVMLQFMPDWRWLLNRPDSPWYPTMSLFRQKSSGDWTEVIGRVKEELQTYRADAKHNTTRI